MDNDDGYQPQGQDYPYPYSIPQSSAYDYQDFDTGQVVFHDLDKKKNVVKSSNPAPTFHNIPPHPGKTYPGSHGKFFRAPPHPYYGAQAQIHQHTTSQSGQPNQDHAPKKAKRERRKKKKANESSDQLVPCTNTAYLQVQPGMRHHGNRLEKTRGKNHESSTTARESSQKTTVMEPSNSDTSIPDHPPNSILTMRLDSIYYRTIDVENIREEDVDLNLLEGDDLELDDSMEEGRGEAREPALPPQPSEAFSKTTVGNGLTSGQNTNTPSPARIHDHGRNTNSPIPASIPDHPPNSIMNMRLDSIYFRTMDVENIGEEDIDLNFFEGDDMDLEDLGSSPPSKRTKKCPSKASSASASSRSPVHNSCTPSPVFDSNKSSRIASPSEVVIPIESHNSQADHHTNAFVPATPAYLHYHPPNSILNMRLDSIYYRTMDVENINEDDIDLNFMEGDDLDLESMDMEDKGPKKPDDGRSVQATPKKPIQKESAPATKNQTSTLKQDSLPVFTTPIQNSSTPSPTSIHDHRSDCRDTSPPIPTSIPDHPPNSILNLRLDSIYYRTMDVENIGEEDIDLNLLEGDDLDLDETPEEPEVSEKIPEPVSTKSSQKSLASTSQVFDPNKSTTNPSEAMKPSGSQSSQDDPITHTPANLHDHPPNSIMNMRLDSIYYRTMDVENITAEDINLNFLEGDDIDLEAIDAEETTPGASIVKLPQTAVPDTTKKSTQKISEPLLNISSPSPAGNPQSNENHKSSDHQKIQEHPPNSILNMRLDSIYYRTMDVENITEEDIDLNLLEGDDDIDLDDINGNKKDHPQSRNQSVKDKNVGQQETHNSTERTLETRGRNMEYLDLDTMKTVGTQSLQYFPPTPQPVNLPDHAPNSIMNLRLDSVYYRTMDVENIDLEDILEKDDLNIEEMESEDDVESNDPNDSRSPTKQPSPLRHRSKNSTSPTSNTTSSSDEESYSEGDDESSEDEEEDVVISIIKKAPNRNKSQIISGNCSNCSVKESTYWRKNKNGEQVCNPCALYEKKMGVKRPESLWKKEINRREGNLVKEKQIKNRENKEKRTRPCIICEKSCRTVRNPPLCKPCRKVTANTAMECSICGESGKKLATHYFVKGKAQCYQCYEKKIDRKSNAGKARIAAEKEKARKEAEAKAKEIEHIFAIPQLPSDKPRCHKCAVSDVKLVNTNLFDGNPPTCRKCYLAAWREKKRLERPTVAKPKECHECVKCGATGVKMERFDPVTKARTCKKCYSRELYYRNKEKRLNEGK